MFQVKSATEDAPQIGDIEISPIHMVRVLSGKLTNLKIYSMAFVEVS